MMSKGQRARIIERAKYLYRNILQHEADTDGFQHELFMAQYVGFKTGVYMAYPKGKWDQAFNKAYYEVREELGLGNNTNES